MRKLKEKLLFLTPEKFLSSLTFLKRIQVIDLLGIYLYFSLLGRHRIFPYIAYGNVFKIIIGIWHGTKYNTGILFDPFRKARIKVVILIKKAPPCFGLFSRDLFLSLLVNSA